MTAFGYSFCELADLPKHERPAASDARLAAALALLELGAPAKIRLLRPSAVDGADVVSSCSLRGISDPSGWVGIVIGEGPEMRHAAMHESRHSWQWIHRRDMPTPTAEADAETWARARCAPGCPACAEPIEALVNRATAGAAALTRSTQGGTHA